MRAHVHSFIVTMFHNKLTSPYCYMVDYFMLNPFPLLFLAPLGYFILRTGIAIILINLALRHFSYRHELIATSRPRLHELAPLSIWFLCLGELFIGATLFLGIYTQYAAIALALMAFELSLTRHMFSHPSIPTRSFYLLLLCAALSLFFTGGGAFAVDLPI